MAESKGKVGSLFYGMTLDTKEFKKRLKSVRKTTKTIGKEITSTFKAIAKSGALIGAGIGAGTAAMLLFTKASLDAIKAQVILAESIGSTQGEIAGLELFTKTMGVETQMVIDKMREFGGLDKFKEMAEQVKNAGDEQAQLNKSIELFGNEGTKMLPILQQGAAGFANMEKKALELGLALSPEQVEKSRVVWEQLSDTWDNIKGIGTQIAQRLIKPLGLLAAGAKAFVVTFRDDMLKGVEWVAGKLESFIKGAFAAFAKYGIPFINSFINFVNQLGQAFNTLFTWLSPATNTVLGGFEKFWTKMTDFVATFKDSLIFGFADGINSVIRGFFGAVRKVVHTINQARLIAIRLLDGDAVTQAASDAFLAQEIAITKMGENLSKPFVAARDQAFQNMVDIIKANMAKSKKQAALWKGVLGDFEFSFLEAKDKAEKAGLKEVEKTVKAVAIGVSKQMIGMIESGSQEEQNILNRKQDKNLVIQQKQLTEIKELKRAVVHLGEF